MQLPIRTCLVICFLASATTTARGDETAVSSPERYQPSEDIIRRAEANAEEISSAAKRVPASQQAGLQFLIENMPTRDLQSLSADFLLSHVALAYESREAANWGDKIPEPIFLNDVLPYASVDEQRDDVRRELREKFWPKIRELESASLAAARLNQLVFSELGVKYSTRRRAANQGPAETMESGLASCTGLSILLIDTCRACGIPARFVGVPMWTNNSGNHSWVEIWDDGWHFTGAAEPTGDKLNRGWFVGRASEQKLGDRRYGIFATSFKKTDSVFPLAWSRFRKPGNEIYCVEVTERYAKKEALPDGFFAIEFKTLGAKGPDRCQANLVLKDSNGNVVFRGRTHDDSFDMNDHLTAKLEKETYQLESRTAAGTLRENIVAEARDTPITLRVPQASASSPIEALKEALLDSNSELKELGKRDWASAPLTKEQATEAKSMLLQNHLAKLQKSRQAEHDGKVLEVGDLKMKFDFTIFGDKPEAGRSLYISMHGGGSAPARVNDGQWRNQKRLYQLEEGVYVAPRAPTDSWNMWHQGHIDAFFTRLIENMIVFEDVNPNRVYITGYSAGGDGVYQLAPRMADQLAAAAMMAGHPNETRPDGLRNLPFTLHMGAKDGAYSRNKKAEQWKEMLANLRNEDPDGYEHWVEIHEGKGHWMDRQDAEGVEWMAQFERNRAPEKVVWLQDDVTHDRFYWLAVAPEQKKGRAKIVARREGNNFWIDESTVPEFSILLDDDFVDLNKSITVYSGDAKIYEGQAQRSIKSIINTLVDRSDSGATYCSQVQIQIPNK